LDDFISFEGKKYTIAMVEESTPLMISKKYLDKEIGVVEEFIEESFEKIKMGVRIFSCSWEKGTKLYKIKQIDQNKYIAVEWTDVTAGNKYYVYCCQKDISAEQILQKYFREK
jgi:hypothetical protein